MSKNDVIIQAVVAVDNNAPIGQKINPGKEVVCLLTENSYFARCGNGNRFFKWRKISYDLLSWKIKFSGTRSRSSSANFYLDSDIGGTAYFEFPRQYLGSQIKSFGGTLSYDLSFQGSSYVNSPDLILIGDDYQLYHTLNRRLRLSQNNQISVRFWPGDWRKNSPQGPIATKEEILMTLQNLQHLLLR